MAIESKTIHVTTGSELDRLVEAAKETPVILEKDGIRYRLSREGDAATAIDHDLTLLTRNRRHFERIPGLELYQSS